MRRHDVIMAATKRNCAPKCKATMIEFAPPSLDCGGYKNIYLYAYHTTFERMDNQASVIARLGDELGGVSVLFSLPYEMMIELVGIAAGRYKYGEDYKGVFIKKYYARKLTEVYDYLCDREQEHEDAVIKITDIRKES